MLTISVFLAITLSYAALALNAQWPLIDPVGADSDPAGRSNIASRLEITSPANATLFCARDGDTFDSGYVHLTNYLGIEDKHMFWWLFKARKSPENAPVILVFGGGPGSSGLFFPFGGAGPCRLQLKMTGTVLQFLRITLGRAISIFSPLTIPLASDTPTVSLAPYGTAAPALLGT